MLINVDGICTIAEPECHETVQLCKSYKFNGSTRRLGIVLQDPKALEVAGQVV